MDAFLQKNPSKASLRLLPLLAPPATIEMARGKGAEGEK